VTAGLLTTVAMTALPVESEGQTFREPRMPGGTGSQRTGGLLPVSVPPQSFGRPSVVLDNDTGWQEFGTQALGTQALGTQALETPYAGPPGSSDATLRIAQQYSEPTVTGLNGYAEPPYMTLDGRPAITGLDAPALPPPDPAMYPPTRISEYKKGAFQKLVFTGTWLPRDSEQNLGWSRWDVALSIGVPAPTIEWPLLLTPTFTVLQTEGPMTPSLPAELYQASLQMTWLPKISERWRLILSVNPGVYSDFQSTDSSAFRITGLGLAAYDWVPDRLNLVLGVVYLDRDDINILPAAGLTWTPNDDWKLELVMPRPRLARRLNYDVDFENWLYLAGEIGGGTWQIQLDDMTTQRMTVRDFRIVLGVERKLDGGAGGRLEVGYVLGRQIEFRDDPTTYPLGDTFMLRGGVAF
jgi:hypothetical protein